MSSRAIQLVHRDLSQKFAGKARKSEAAIAQFLQSPPDQWVTTDTNMKLPDLVSHWAIRVEVRGYSPFTRINPREGHTMIDTM